MVAHAIKNDIDPLAPRQFRGRNKIGVGCYYDYLIDLLLESQRRDVQAQPHIYAFLLGVDFEIIISGLKGGGVFDQSYGSAFTQAPARGIIQASKPDCDLTQLLDFTVKLESEFRVRRLSKIDRFMPQGRVHPLGKRRAIVKKQTIELARLCQWLILCYLILNIGWPNPLYKMPVRQHTQAMRNAGRITSIMIWETLLEATQKECAIHEDRSRHEYRSNKLSPGAALS